PGEPSSSIPSQCTEARVPDRARAASDQRLRSRAHEPPRLRLGRVLPPPQALSGPSLRSRARGRPGAPHRAGRARAAAALGREAGPGRAPLPLRHAGAPRIAVALALRAARTRAAPRLVRAGSAALARPVRARVHDRIVSRLNPTVRGFLIIVLIAGAFTLPTLPFRPTALRPFRR